LFQSRNELDGVILLASLHEKSQEKNNGTSITSIDEINFNFKSYTEAETFVDEYQVVNSVKFSVYKTDSSFNTKGEVKSFITCRFLAIFLAFIRFCEAKDIKGSKHVF